MIQKISHNYIILITIQALLIYTINAEKTSQNNGLLKKRVAERQANGKVDSLLGKIKNNNMQELASSLENMNKLCQMLDVSSVDEAIKKVESMQKDIDKLLASLDADSVSEGIKQAKQIRSITKQLSQLHLK